MLDATARGAWELLADRVGAYVGRRLPTDDAEDVRQDVLLRIFQGAPSLNDEARFGPWVYSIARNAVVDRLRARKLPTTDLDIVDPPAEARDDEVRPLLSCVTPFVSRLPSPYREAITLTELNGLTQQEAAEIEGVSLSGMKSRVQRGRKMLKTMFEECCHLTVDGRGKVIEAKRRVSVESARPEDLPAILELLRAQNLPADGLADHLATTLVARKDGQIVGSVAIEVYREGGLLRSVAVAGALQGQGLGRSLTDAAFSLAKNRGLSSLYLLTTTAEAYFPKFGFERIGREDVPASVRASVEFTSACPSSAVVMRRRL